VVGADGLYSRTRRMMVGPGADDGLRPIKGTFIGYFIMPEPIKEGEEYIASAYIAPGAKGVFLRRSHPDKVQVYIGGICDAFDNVPRGDVKAEKAAMTKLFQGVGWETEKILRSMNTDNDFYLERLGMVQLDRWFRGRVALVGDAAWCPTANTGMGTTSAMVGAYILAGEISRQFGRADKKGANNNKKTTENIARALSAYDTKFRPFMDQVQKDVPGSGDGYGWKFSLMTSSLGVSLMYFTAGLASFFKINFAAMMLKEKVDDWELPYYEVLLQE
jgi:2-polyprenyl-6-methoxyphenol hydroxylase-like FAD-dependent oxidoreductase